MVQELKDLQVAPGTSLAKFQVKVKGEGERDEGQGAASRGGRSPVILGVFEGLWRAG